MRPARQQLLQWLGLGSAAALAALALMAQAPPAPRASSAPDTAVSAQRARAHLEVIAREPRPVGSPAHAATRDYLQAQLQALGLETEVQRTLWIGQRFGNAAMVENVVGRLPGHDPSGAILLVAHYDSVPSSPGAADNGAGVVAILEALRALRASAPLDNDVLVLFSDAEELGLLGAEAFAAEHPWMADVSLVVNLEARGSGGPAVLVETQPGNRELMREFARVVPYPNATSLAVDIYRLLPNDTDFSVFRDQGVPGFNFAFIRGAAQYHSPVDDLERLDLGSLQQHAEHVLALARHFGARDLGAPLVSPGDAVFFDLGRLVMVHYPATLALPLGLGGGVIWLLVVLLARARGAARVRGVAVALVAWTVTAAAAFAAATLAFALLRRVEPAFAVMWAGNVYHAEVTMLAMVLLTLALVAASASLATRWLRTPELALGALAVWTVVSLVVSVTLPGASYLTAWPLLGGLLALALVIARHGRGPWRLTPGRVVVLVLGALPLLLLYPPFVAEGFIALGLALAGPMMAAVATAVGPVVALLPRAGTRSAWALPALFLTASLVTFAVGARLAAFDDTRPAPSSAAYLLDDDAGQALYLSAQAATDDWTAQFLDGARVADVEPLLPGFGRMLLAPAPLVALPAPELTLLSDVVDGAVRELRLRLASSRDAPVLALGVGAETPVEALLVEGRPVASRHLGADGANLTISGRFDDGVELVLVTQAIADVELTIADLSWDLLHLPELQVPPRPPHLMRAQTSIADAVIVRRSWSLPGAIAARP
jgi:hypothetical protein